MTFPRRVDFPSRRGSIGASHPSRALVLHLTTPTTGQLSLIQSGPPGILETLRVMSRMAREGKKNLFVRQTAAAKTASCGSGNKKDWSCEVRQLHAFVRDDIRYVQDIVNVETVQSAEKTLEFGYGDCDDKSVLLAALLESIGHPTHFVAIGFQPQIFEHVYVETKIGDRWIPLETTEDVEAGWDPSTQAAHVRARMIY